MRPHALHHRYATLLAAVLLAGAVPCVRAQTAVAVRHFDEGNRRYAAGDYRGALSAYAAAAAGGRVSGALYYNMGNAYFRLDELGQAIRYYEKARLLMPDRPELLHNLSIARGRTVDTFSRLPEPFWQTWWRAFVAWTGIGVLLAAGLLLYLTATALVGYRLWTGDPPRWTRRARNAALVAGVLLLVVAFAASVDRSLDRRAVVVAEAVELREAPRADAPAALDVHEGLTVDVLDVRDGWREVRLPNGTVGWLAEEDVADV